METRIPLRRIGVIAAGAFVVGVAIYVAVFRGHSDHDLTLYGNVDIREVTIGFRVPGRLASLDVDEGDTVRARQAVARLDLTPLTLELNEARANATSLAARYALYKSGYRVEEVELARANAAERRAALQNADQGLARQEQLKGTGAVAQRSYDDAVATRDQARARLVAAEQTLAELEHGYRHEEVAEVAANYARATASVAQAEQRLDDAVLRAPADGIVLTRAVEPGAILGAGTPVFTISLLAPVWARVYVDEPNLGRVASGSSVLVYTDSRPNQPYHGRVGFVSPTAEFTPKNVETPDLRTSLVYRARVVVTDPDRSLRQGMPVTVRVAAPSTPSK